MGTTSSLSNSDRYAAAHDSAEFAALRRRSHTFTLYASVAFAGWWLLTILLGAFVPGFYRQSITGSFNVGLLFVLITFALVVAISATYLRFARSRLDPLAEQIRVDLEGEQR